MGETGETVWDPRICHTGVSLLAKDHGGWLHAHSWWNASYLVLFVVDESSTDQVSSENPFHS